MNIKSIILLLCITVCTLNAFADEKEESSVRIYLNKELCNSGEGLALITSSESSLATINRINSQIDEKEGKECTIDYISLMGDIKEKTFERIKLAYLLLKSRRKEEHSEGSAELVLTSSGGLITEAIKIGDFVGDKQIQSFVPIECLSSCVLIYAAASIRLKLGAIGIHRPFSTEIDSYSLSYSEYLKKYELITPILKRYLSKYGVSPMLVDAMNVIPSDKVKILTDEELEQYGLGALNIASLEHTKARVIQICGQDFHNMYRAFQSTLNSCVEHYSYEKYYECKEFANQEFPKFAKMSDECDIKMSVTD